MTDREPEAMSPDDIADRVGCHGMGIWLQDFVEWLGPPMQPAAIVARRAEIASPRHDVTAVIHRLPGRTTNEMVWNEWVLESLLVKTRGGLPFGLDRVNETPRSAERKLSMDFVPAPVDPPQGGKRISYFVDDGRVVELTFRSGEVGLRQVLVVRLGGPLERRMVTCPRFWTARLEDFRG